MAKKVTKQIKLQIPGGKATPGNPVSTSLGPCGVNIPEFIRQFNEKSAHQAGLVTPVVVTLYDDRSFILDVRCPTVTALLKNELKLEKGSSAPNQTKVGKLTKERLRKIAEMKISELNATTIEAAMNIIAGSARSMGLDVEGY